MKINKNIVCALLIIALFFVIYGVFSSVEFTRWDKNVERSVGITNGGIYYDKTEWKWAEDQIINLGDVKVVIEEDGDIGVHPSVLEYN